MPNPFFKFKNFTVYHDQCAMKVGTDGVLLGAWCDVSDAKKALDIGTGTGLIALMIAQRNPLLKIDAIDIDDKAILQAKENIDKSEFSSQIACSHQSLQDFYKGTKNKYDVIVSNPPFFVNSLKSKGVERTLARHTDSLNIEDLFFISSGLLSDKGKLFVIYPAEQKESLIHLAKESNLLAYRITDVYSTEKSTDPKRVLLSFSREQLPVIENELFIEKERHVYSDDFIRLAKDFYLNM
ncbi:MAG: methyltransferase [Prevotella sp.]|jgi:tRNA1Val (adenine37-N6)-methyltransferase|nr:methyltransferase [Prevotella sp.]